MFNQKKVLGLLPFIFSRIWNFAVLLIPIFLRSTHDHPTHLYWYEHPWYGHGSEAIIGQEDIPGVIVVIADGVCCLTTERFIVTQLDIFMLPLGHFNFSVE